MINVKLAGTIGLTLLLMGCSSTDDLQANMFGPETYLKESKEVNTILEEKQVSDLIVLDVRTPSEFASGCLTGAKNLDMQADDFVKKIDQLDKDKPYLVYCRSGRRSAVAVEQMKEAGFTKVMELRGGIVEWEKNGEMISQNCK